jgi:hypothetical protein
VKHFLRGARATSRASVADAIPRPRRRSRRPLFTPVLVLAHSLLPLPASGQLVRDSSSAWLTSAGSEAERYLRALQVAGEVPVLQWSSRPFSLRQLPSLAAIDSAHPWARSLREANGGAVWLRPIQPELGGVYNTTFPYGFNDGPVWAGRGLTTVAAAGIEGELGQLEITIAPQLFRAENASFPLAPTGVNGPNRFADPVYGQAIDLPQRFGDHAYQRLDPGQSSLRLHVTGLALGISTANEAWGPAVESPFLLGNNAAGFGHLFFGTDGPIRFGPVIASGRLIAGRLDQSNFSAVTQNQRRYLTGTVLVFGLQSLPGLEIGLGRVFENVWPDSGLTVGDILRPLVKNPLKGRLAAKIGNGGNEPDNQLASIFGRWVLPKSGIEVYGELGREDNSFDTRDLILEPDHEMSYMLGFQRVWLKPGGELLALRGEILNTMVSHLAAVRSESPPYVHDPIRQGYTQIGQVLGAPAGFGGGSSSIALDWFHSGGRRTITWRRWHREPSTYVGEPPDIVHDVSVDWLLFRRHIDVAPEATLSYELNRPAGGDALNLRFGLAGKAHW